MYVTTIEFEFVCDDSCLFSSDDESVCIGGNPGTVFYLLWFIKC